MNSKERLIARIKGQPVDRPPNLDIFMTFASHYIYQPLYFYSLDYRVLSEANLALMGERAAPCGNMDTVSIMLQGTAEQVYADTMRAIQQDGSRGLNAAGCEIPDGAPEENLHAQSAALNSYMG